MVCVCIYVYVLLCVIYLSPFHVPCTICKYLGLVITILNYIAALLTLSSKDSLSYFFTVQSDDMVICSLNVRGLSSNTKRRETFLWLKKNRLSICSLQEVHSTNETEPYWHSEWGYSTIFTTFSSSRAGVNIMFNNNFQFQILKHSVDPEGRFIVDIDTGNKIMTLVNVYAPHLRGQSSLF